MLCFRHQVALLTNRERMTNCIPGLQDAAETYDSLLRSTVAIAEQLRKFEQENARLQVSGSRRL